MSHPKYPKTFWVAFVGLMILLMSNLVQDSLVQMDNAKIAKSMLDEQDPLTVIKPESETRVVVDDGSFSFYRGVCAQQNVVVSVHRQFKNLETNELYLLPSTTYGTQKSDECILMRFVVAVPSDLPKGIYLYTPLATYAINEVKTITKELPSERVIIQ